MPDATDSGYSYLPGSVPWLIPFAGDTVGAAIWTVANVGFFVSGLFAALYRDLGRTAGVPFAFVLLGLIVFLPTRERSLLRQREPVLRQHVRLVLGCRSI